MITLIISALSFLALVALCLLFPSKSNKTLIMAGIVMLMLILTIVDQLIIPKHPLAKVNQVQHFQMKTLPAHLMLNISSQLYKNTPMRPLIKQQRTLLAYLVEKENQKENIINYITNLDNSRFRAIFREFQVQTNAPALFVDYNSHDYTYSDLESALTEGKGNYNKYKNKIVYFILQNINSFQQITSLQNIFLSYNVSYLLQNIPQNLLEMSSFGKWIHKIQFEGNYMAQVLENHPPRLVQLCSKYRPIDYTFYIMSQTESLAELCTKLPLNSVTECIRKFMQKAQDRLPFSKVRKCFVGNFNQNVEGVIYENGMIGLKRDHFYSGKVDRSIFTIDSTHNQNQNL